MRLIGKDKTLDGKVEEEEEEEEEEEGYFRAMIPFVCTHS